MCYHYPLDSIQPYSASVVENQPHTPCNAKSQQKISKSITYVSVLKRQVPKQATHLPLYCTWRVVLPTLVNRKQEIIKHCTVLEFRTGQLPSLLTTGTYMWKPIYLSFLAGARVLISSLSIFFGKHFDINAIMSEREMGKKLVGLSFCSWFEGCRTAHRNCQEEDSEEVRNSILLYPIRWGLSLNISILMTQATGHANCKICPAAM